MNRPMPIRVMTVDDSPTVRRLIAAKLDGYDDICCIDGGAHPLEARDKIKASAPDVLILDIDMPHMDGIEFLRKIMSLRPMPVLMFSSCGRSGSRRALEALEIGAVDYLEKTPDMARDGTLARLADLVRMAATARVTPWGRRRVAQPCHDTGSRNRGSLLLMGSSTGGVQALETILSRFPETCPPTLITQHMPRTFLRNFVKRMDHLVRPRIKIAEAGEPLVEGTVYIAPGGDHHLAVAPGTPCRCVLDSSQKVSGHRPSVDVLLRSAVPIADRVVAVILTGMGYDGARGMKALREAGARTLAQDEASSVVFGMPRVALDLGAAERAVPLEDLAAAALDLCAQRAKQTV